MSLNSNGSCSFTGDAVENQAYVIARTILFIIVSLVIFLGNLLVIASVVQFKALWTVTNKFLISLSIADTVSSVAIQSYFSFLVYTYDVTIWRWGLLLNMFPAMLSQGVSLLTLLHIAIDRYIAVIHAVSYKQLMTHRVANIMIVSTWVYFITILSIIIGYSGYTVKDEVFENRRLIEAVPEFILQVVVSPHIYLAILVTCLLYAKIFWALRSKKVGQVQKSASAEAKTRRVTHMMATVVVILLVCWMPMAIFNSVVDKSERQIHYMTYVQDLCNLLLYTNSCTNPILYGLKSPEFRKSYIKMLSRCKVNRNSVGLNEHSTGSTKTEHTHA